MVGISIHNETDYALTEAMTQEILEPTASGGEGYYVVLRRVHEPYSPLSFGSLLGVYCGGRTRCVGCSVRAGGREPSRSHAGVGSWCRN